MYHYIEKRKLSLEQEISFLQQQLDQSPPGSIMCFKNGNYSSWYHLDSSNPPNQRYMHKSELDLAQSLAYKKYLELRLNYLLIEQKATHYYLKHFHPDMDRSLKLLADNSPYKDLLSPYLSIFSQSSSLCAHAFNASMLDLSNPPQDSTKHPLYVSAWEDDNFQRNPNHPEHLIHKSISGQMLRSKSEVLIDMALRLNHIPHRYECLLHLDQRDFYPDFTILHPHTNDVLYWEHFGLMDDPAYSEKAFSKMNFYCKHNIIPSINLITTYETKEHPLNIETVNSLIQHYFT